MGMCSLCTVKRLVKEERFPHVLFYGPPGTGKTSTILAVARQMYGPSMRSMVLELNASDDRGIAIVREQVVDFASTRTMFRQGTLIAPKLPACIQFHSMHMWPPFAQKYLHAPTCLLPHCIRQVVCCCSNKFKLVILDECDAMTRDAQFALRRGEAISSDIVMCRVVCAIDSSQLCDSMIEHVHNIT